MAIISHTLTLVKRFTLILRCIKSVKKKFTEEKVTQQEQREKQRERLKKLKD